MAEIKIIMSSLFHLLVLLLFNTKVTPSILPEETQPATATCNSCCLQGPAGASGVPGSAGVPGSHGLPGRDGLTGGIGLKGEPGVGLSGPRGLVGVIGERGERGERGEPGSLGFPGKVGPRGVEGRQGIGFKGDSGNPGLKGSKGESAIELRRSAFSVFKSSHQTSSSGSVVTFEEVDTNIGSHFSMSTNKFTCQIPGTYFFTFTIFSQYEKDDPCVDLVQDDRRVARVSIYTTVEPTSSNHHQQSNSAILQLSAGNQVWLKTCRGDKLYGSSLKLVSFTGFLIFAE